MRVAVAGALALLVAACGPPSTNGDNAPHDRQPVTNTTPGVSITGSAEFGVVRRF